MSDFRALLERAAARFPSKQVFAKELGITPSRFSRLLRGEFSLEVVNCLRLAKLAGESPSRVLRVAGKADVADLIEQLYDRPSLTQRERDLLAKWRRLRDSAPNRVAIIENTLDEFLAEPADEKPVKKRRTA